METSFSRLFLAKTYLSSPQIKIRSMPYFRRGQTFVVRTRREPGNHRFSSSLRADTTSSTALGTFHAAALHLIRPRRQLLLCRCPRTSDRYRSPCNAGTRSQCGTARTTCPGGLSHSRDTACKFPRPECRSQNKCERPCCTSAITAEWMMVVVLPSGVKQLALNPLNLDPITYRLLAASMAGDHPLESRTRLAFTPTTTILRGMGSTKPNTPSPRHAERHPAWDLDVPGRAMRLPSCRWRSSP